MLGQPPLIEALRHFPAPRIRNWLRISIGTAAECDALLQAMAEITARA